MTLASLNDGEGWLLRPVAHKYCTYESLKNGTLDLCDVALMNDAIDVDEENRARIAEYTQRLNME